MSIEIYNHIIDVDIDIILDRIKDITHGEYIKDMKRSGTNLLITCPFHNNHNERHPSCGVCIDPDSPLYGIFHCFTCGEKGPLFKLVAKCLDLSIEDAKQWLIDNFSNTYTEQVLNLPEINLTPKSKEYLDESILDEYSYFHPYMFKRGLNEEVIKKFNIGWDSKVDAITFPVWDEHNNLLGVTRRSVNRKYFHIPEGIDKPVYLLNFIIRDNISEVYVVESQIDALYLWSMGYPAIALLGTGVSKQYEVLKKSGIRVFHLALDGDMAGRHGNLRFIKNMPNDCLIDIIDIPNGKDVNDLTKEQLDSLQRIDKNIYK